jgi:hypothetical protein
VDAVLGIEIGIPTIRAPRAHVHARAPMNSM